MDFKDTPEQAKFRKTCREWLEKNAKLKTGVEKNEFANINSLQVAKDWQKKKYDAGELAEQFSMPVITFIDTAGAYPGIEGEERGQSEAIARNLAVMSELKTPILVVVTGEGGSGGALAISVGDNIAMLQYATYSVASPEACASIIWRTAEKAPDAAEAMKVSAKELKKLKIIDEIIEEPLGGAHRDYDLISSRIKDSLIKNLSTLNNMSLEQLLDRRYKRLIEVGT